MEMEERPFLRTSALAALLRKSGGVGGVRGRIEKEGGGGVGWNGVKDQGMGVEEEENKRWRMGRRKEGCG